MCAAGNGTMFSICASFTVSGSLGASAGSSAARKSWKKRSASASFTPCRKRRPPVCRRSKSASSVWYGPISAVDAFTRTPFR
jgi:hypothetical protein